MSKPFRTTYTLLRINLAGLNLAHWIDADSVDCRITRPAALRVGQEIVIRLRDGRTAFGTFHRLTRTGGIIIDPTGLRVQSRKIRWVSVVVGTLCMPRRIAA